MIRNKVLRSAFALILALSMLVPGFNWDVEAAESQSDLKIRSIFYSQQFSCYAMDFETADMAASVKEVYVNDTKYSTENNIELFRQAVREKDHVWRIKANYGYRQIHLSKIEDGDTVSLVTDKGRSVFVVSNAKSTNSPELNFIPKTGGAAPSDGTESESSDQNSSADTDGADGSDSGENAQPPSTEQLRALPLRVHQPSGLNDDYYLEAIGKNEVFISLQGMIKSVFIGNQEYTPGTSKDVKWLQGNYYFVKENRLYIRELKDKEILHLVDYKGFEHYYLYNEADKSLTYTNTEPQDHYQLRLKGKFEAAMFKQKDYDGISGASIGGSVNNQNSDVIVQYTNVAGPREEDWINIGDENPNQKYIKILFSDAVTGDEVDTGMKGMLNNITSKLTLNGTPNRVGKFKISLVYNRNNKKVVSNALDFNVYGLEEKLADYYKVKNAKKFEHGEKCYWDVEPWYIKNFGGKNETVVAPKEIKAVFGSRQSGTYGVWGYPIREDQTPEQTLIVGEGTDLTLVNMKILSSIQIIVKDGGKLNLRDSSLQGRVVVQNGGTLEVNYDAHNKTFVRGSSINGQIVLQEGATLANSLLSSNTNYLPNGDGSNSVPAARHNVKPVLLVTGNAKIEGRVFVRGDEAPTGTDKLTGRNYSGQPAIGIVEGATLTVPKGSVLGAYGGGWIRLTDTGGAAVILKDGARIAGEGSLIAMPGASSVIDPYCAVEGNGTIAVKQVYIRGGNNYRYEGGKPLASTVMIDKSVKPIGKVFDGKSKSQLNGSMEYDDLYYWFSSVELPEYRYLADEKQPIFKDEEEASQAGETGNTNAGSTAGGSDQGTNTSTGTTTDSDGSTGDNSSSGSTTDNTTGGNANSSNSSSENTNTGSSTTANTNSGEETTGNTAGGGTTTTGSTGENTSSTGDNGAAVSTGGGDTNTTSAPETIKDDKTPLGTVETEISLGEFKPEVKEALEAIMKHSEEDKAAVEDFLNRKISPADFASKVSEEALEVSKTAVFKLFKDVPETAWYAKELSALQLIRLIEGYEDGTLRPENMVTGRELITVLVRAGEWEIKVMDGDWFAPYLEAAKVKGLILGLDLDLAKPLTREEITALLYNFIKVQKGGELKAEGELKFTDKDMISKAYSAQVAYLADKGVLQGYTDDSFMPRNNVKRSEIVALIYRVLRMK